MVFGPQLNKQSLLSLGPGVVLSFFAFLAPLYWVRSAASTRFATVNDSLIAVQTKLAALPKFGRLRGSNSVSLKIGESLAIREKLASFGNVRSHLFCSTC